MTRPRKNALVGFVDCKGGNVANLKELEDKIKELKDNSAFYGEANSMLSDLRIFFNKHKLGTVVAFMIFIGLIAVASML